MGNVSSNDIVVTVQTGNKRSAGTDAAVWMVAHDEDGNASEEIKLSHIIESEFERGKKDVFDISRRRFSELTSPISKLELWRDYPGMTSSWFVDTITLEDTDCQVVDTFPVFRWIRPSYRYVFRKYDTVLPEDDLQKDQREEEMDDARRTYKLNASGDPGMPIQVAHVPCDEEFLEVVKRRDVVALVRTLSRQLKTDAWKSVKDITDIYYSEQFYIPKCQLFWQEDWCFGYQRLNGVNPCLITLCKSIPKKFDLSDSMVKPFLEGMSLKSAMKAQKIYICNLEIMQHVETANETTICSPFALFYLDKRNTLVPVAIQLFHEPSDANPVFLPSDDEYVWQLAKMWYNNAEANHHLAVTYIGWNCLLMESVSLSLHRQLSISHPLYKLMAPYFTYIMAANHDITHNLMADGGVLDRVMTIGVRGVKTLVKKSLENWHLNVDSCLPEDLLKREVSDTRQLPGYYYRDDGMLLYYAIQNYVIKYITLYYGDCPKRIEGDTELQSWLKEMTTSRDDGGMGIEGVPGYGSPSTADKIEGLFSSIINTSSKQVPSAGRLNQPQQLQELLTSILFTCSVQHAAVGGAMYDTYGFPPNYPLRLNGKPPASKDAREECDVMSALETGGSWTEAVALARVLCESVSKGTLGEGDSIYLHDPDALDIHSKFRAELKEIDKVIQDRNSSRNHSYHYLIPSTI